METRDNRIILRLNAAAIAADLFMEDDAIVRIEDGGVRCVMTWTGPDGNTRTVDNFTPWSTIEMRTSFNPLLSALQGLQLQKKYSGVSG